MKAPTALVKLSAKQYSEEKFWKKLTRYASKAGQKVVYLALLLYYVLLSDRVSKQDKLKICGALGYLIVPTDMIPDALMGLGFTDDLAALVWAFKAVSSNITPEMEERAAKQLEKWFGTVDKQELASFE